MKLIIRGSMKTIEICATEGWLIHVPLSVERVVALGFFGHALKYMYRSNGRDLEKAAWFLRRCVVVGLQPEKFDFSEIEDHFPPHTREALLAIWRATDSADWRGHMTRAAEYLDPD
jgi:hypothetical protein